MGWSGRAPAPPEGTLDLGLHQMEHPMPKTANVQIALVGVAIGKNSFHVVGQDSRGAIILREKWVAPSA
jgi:transposase